MKTIQQAFRQPMRTLAGILLITMAVSILITCVGQYAAASVTRAELDRQYDTVALTTDELKYLPWPENERYTKWYQEIVEHRSDIVKTISDAGLLSAYIPDLTPDNYTQHFTTAGSAYNTLGNPYTCAMLVITLNEIGKEVTEEKASIIASDGFTEDQTKCVSIQCKGTVEQIIALQEGFHSPVGYTIDLTIRVANRAVLEELDLEIGEKYLVYGMDYFDNDWLLRKWVSENEATFQKPFDMNKVHEDHPLGSDYESVDLSGLNTEFYYYENFVHGKTVYVPFSSTNLEMVKNCSLTVCDYASLPDMIFKLDENNHILGFEMLEDKRVMLEDENSDGLMQYGTTLVDVEQYMQMYSVPTIVKVRGEIKDFINSESGSIWKSAIDSTNINNHTFPVLAVDKLGYQAEFAREQARIVNGRDFTQKELESGTKVCIISESQAVNNGLSVGDTITLHTFSYDPNMNECLAYYPQTSFPYASFYSPARGFEGNPSEYTIVGLYRQDNAWDSFSSYGFTTNTVFISKNSTNSKMVVGNGGLFRSTVLHNGAIEKFQILAEEAGYTDYFVFYDRGYNEIFSGLNAYEELAGKAVFVGIGAYAINLLLFLLLFPGRQKRTLATMGSLGTPKRKKFAFVFSGSFVILLPGTVLGAMISTVLREYAAAELMESIGVSVPLVFSSAAATIAVSAAQLAVAMAAVSVLGMLLVREHGFSRK